MITIILAACPQTQKPGPTDQVAKPDAPSNPDASRQDQRPAVDSHRGPLTTLPAGKPWVKCDGSLSLEDIPDTPLTAVLAGKKLDAVAQAVRASVLGRSVSFDFAQAVRFDKKTPCFIAETHLSAGLERVDSDYEQSIMLPAGQYRLGEGWKATYNYQDASGKRILRSPTFYGLLVLESATGLNVKPKQMFTPTGRVKGKLAICFKDKQRSWIAGAFDVPACGDAK